MQTAPLHAAAAAQRCQAVQSESSLCMGTNACCTYIYISNGASHMPRAYLRLTHHTDDSDNIIMLLASI